ncbi:MAG: site-2 protease family protein [Myxococcota bacterium]
MTGMGVRLGRLLGVEIVADGSLLLIFGLVVVQLSFIVFPAWHPEWGPWLAFGTAVVAALAFFTSILLHELAHAWMARRQGVTVSRITLFLFGGVAQMEEEPSQPRAEFLIAVVGPLCSLILGVASLLLGAVLLQERWSAYGPPSLDLRRLLHDMGPLTTILVWLGQVNVLLGLFNLTPGFPLDGGRLLRAVLWSVTNDLARATRWATNAGRGFAWGLMGLGTISLFQGGIGQGLWLLLIGWFLNHAAVSSYEMIMARQQLAGVRIEQVMTPPGRRIPPSMMLTELVQEVIMTSDQRAFAIVENNQLLGLICLEDVRAVPRPAWATTTAAEAMTPRRRLISVGPSEPAEHAFRLLGQNGYGQLPVVHDGALLGFVQRAGLLRWLALQSPSPGLSEPAATTPA